MDLILEMHRQETDHPGAVLHDNQRVAELFPRDAAGLLPAPAERYPGGAPGLQSCGGRHAIWHTFFSLHWIRLCASGPRGVSGAVAGAPPRLGVFLLLRRMSLMGDALSHAILPGVAVGVSR